MEIGKLVAEEPHALFTVAHVSQLSRLDPSFNRRGVHVLFSGPRHVAEQNRGLRHRIKAVVFELVSMTILDARKHLFSKGDIAGDPRLQDGLHQLHQFIAQFRAPKITRLCPAQDKSI